MISDSFLFCFDNQKLLLQIFSNLLFEGILFCSLFVIEDAFFRQLLMPFVLKQLERPKLLCNKIQQSDVDLLLFPNPLYFLEPKYFDVVSF